ncbi:MarR family winged helix-turn-helix transcriptional regulator [uncultured Megasphaera sp.]|jgi:MarR family transcriptional regulator for hemolysin|uniref:MarR family winged helix-turn-helix transcriptional regulator n=1 Tax=uncultured Megasphaera sp. TaxID=165188 RepID=UPI0037835C15
MMDVRDRQDDELVRQLFCTTRIFSRTLNGCVAPLGLHSSEWMVLNLVYLNGGIAQADLIRYFKVEAAAITRTLSRLGKKGLICRHPREKGRGKYIELTDAGRDLFVQAEPFVIAHRRQALQGLSPEERKLLLTLCVKVQAALDEV